MADAREVMNIRQASQYLGVSPDTLYKYVSEERIPAFKLGNRWKFKKSILDTWMESQSLSSEVSRPRKLNKTARAVISKPSASALGRLPLNRESRSSVAAQGRHILQVSGRLTSPRNPRSVLPLSDPRKSVAAFCFSSLCLCASVVNFAVVFCPIPLRGNPSKSAAAAVFAFRPSFPPKLIFRN